MADLHGALFKPVFGMFALTGLVVARMLNQRLTAVAAKTVKKTDYILIDPAKLPGEIFASLS